MRKLALSLLAMAAFAVQAQNVNTSKFRQLGQELPTPNVYRTASGAPGHEYYQQRADYDMSVTLDDETQRIYGEETITYTNNSPDELRYLWVQLDQNMRAKNSMTQQIQTGGIFNERGGAAQTAFNQLKNSQFYDFDGGFKLAYVQTTSGTNLPYTVNNTMMRVDLPTPLRQGQKFSFKIKWWFNINDRMDIGGRSGYEYFEEEDNYLYTIAQFFPRMAVYNDVEGWQNKQFLGQGEFTLPFGDYKVSITVPSDHIVASTGELTNASRILTSKQRARLAKAEKSYDDPVIIVTQEEAEVAEKNKAKTTKTWVFEAEDVRDFAFATSRKFIWDAQAVDIGGKTTMAMSYYPKEGNPLWEQYSTRVVAHTLKVYSKFTIDYPYHKAISVHTKWIGMEYPMICFNGGRPEADGTYSEGTKYGMIGVIIHEVGHNFFPMIINSDERQWTWMDEGLNTFVQYLTEQEWDHDYPSRRGPADKIVPYMSGPKEQIVPIMTNSESILQFGNNAYGKPATALNILRETVMGRELFDYAFKEYSRRWAFKHPTPADLFRTMEDASGVDLDWYWRGWFYTTDHVDIAIKDVQWYQMSTKNPDVEKPFEAEKDRKANAHVGRARNEVIRTMVDEVPATRDFYNRYNPFEVSAADREAYESYRAGLSKEEAALLDAGYHFYGVTFENQGGLIMPLVLRFTLEDGTEEVKRIPAEVWLKNEDEFTKWFNFTQPVVQITLDPFLEMADTDRSDNYWPAMQEPSKFDVYSRGATSRWQRNGRSNPMRDARAQGE
ncbi:M1 family metallopeptidase [Schleiferiaceae bacterium]|nr:M1 family metallopeptidase [Schleiferiaceae bacterium]MDC1225475.1 M1 family metallopeptidase [Schleiferiaceae bacterium]MDC1537623.1 M1 family metallopeptidase [Schleiferiaceae bacterium]